MQQSHRQQVRILVRLLIRCWREEDVNRFDDQLWASRDMRMRLVQVESGLVADLTIGDIAEADLKSN